MSQQLLLQPHHYYCILPYTYIYRKVWLTNRSSLPIILNLLSELSAIRTLLLFFLLAADILSLSPKWTLLRLPPTPPTKTAVQPNHPAPLKLLPLVPSPTSSNPNLQSNTLLFLSCFCRSPAHHRDNDSFYRYFVQHSSSGLVEVYNHKLSLLANADEAISYWSKCFSLC